MPLTDLSVCPSTKDEAPISIHLLGATELVAGRLRVQVEDEVRQGVLAALALRPNQLIGVESIAATLWDKPPARALRQILAAADELRKLLNDTFADDYPGQHPVLLGHAGALALCTTPATVDVLLFETKTRNARAQAMAGDLNEARSLFREALSLHPKQPFSMLTAMSGAAPGLRAECLKIRESALSATEDLIEMELALGGHVTAIPELRDLVAGFPLRERLRKDLVLALSRTGRTQEAIDVYCAGVRALADAGVQPSPELTDAYLVAVGRATADPLEPHSSCPNSAAQPVPATDLRTPAQKAEDHHTFRLHANLAAGIGWQPPAHLRAVLEQLLSGATDTTASRRLGLSPRTYSRRVSELLDYLGVDSRFQAGAEALHRGWITPSR
ncbi:BTAD domain-containing putative transcriptional regulator [Actinokineospora guangxiensis]|uniref:BTAD domain-containing putative transcriptional regulator n=1 Tax=Actinokineospora guangxiensis TaxID=1490288 RepID=A0ABW0EW96_9PSEU